MKKTLLLSAFLAVSGAMNAQWTVSVQNTNFFNESEGVQDLVAVDANTVWGLGYDGSGGGLIYQEFTRTANGGTLWETGSIPFGNSALNPTNISAVSATTAWVGAVTDNGGGGVWKTTDGGVIWTQQNSGAYTTPVDSFFNVVHFFNANTGITQGDPINGAFELYRTTNGGSTWAPITSAPAPAPAEYGYNGGNVGVGNSFWFVTNQGKIYRTTDQGVTWTKHNTPITDFAGANTGGSIYFADSNNGILLERIGPAASATYRLYKTTNGGTSWDTGAAFTAPYRNFGFIPGTTTLVANVSTATATTQMTSYSNDMGTTWTVFDQGTQRIGIAFADINNGWAGGFTNSQLSGGIFKFTGTLGINENNKAKVSVYPNPANDVVNIKGASISKVVAFDILGKQVVSQDFSTQDEVSVNVSSLRTGMYVLQVTNDLGATETIKFAKK